MLHLDFVGRLRERLEEPSPLIQVVMGPRQVGKTTGVRQMLVGFKKVPVAYFSADDVTAPREAILEQWQKARLAGPGSILVIDEIHKVPGWSETVKSLWDKEKPANRIKCVLLGSSSLSLQTGVSESLTGRFELIRVPHWNYEDSRRGFKWDLETYLTYGGYPGSYEYVGDWERWREYVHHSIIETVIGKDILGQRSVAKPALFRQAFELLTQYPAQEISYTKLLGQLQDRGNTDLVKHYIELYEGAFLVRALGKYSVKPGLMLRNPRRGMRKSSSPKILPLCPALCTVTEGPDAARLPERRGRLLELAVGMELARLPGELFYWRDGNDEVDYVYRDAGKTFAVEVKSGRKKKAGGLSVFVDRFPRAYPVLVDFENFPAFSKDPEKFLRTVSGIGE